MPVTKARMIRFMPEHREAILEGRKTQTRRVIAHRARGADRVYWHVGETHAWKGHPPQKYVGWVAHVEQLMRGRLGGLLLPLTCPYGSSGDRLWVPNQGERIILEVEQVWAERVQEIRAIDAVAEGCPSCSTDPREAYRVLWDSINAKRSLGWDTNPFVWVIQFKLVGIEQSDA